MLEEGFTYMLYQLSNSGEEFDHYGITNIKYQRRNPISLAVSLDSPEAVSMIRDGGNLTPAEKKKRLEDMLAASDEYMETHVSNQSRGDERAEENLKEILISLLIQTPLSFLRMELQHTIRCLMQKLKQVLAL